MSARSEAGNAFGSGQLLIEKAVIDARHVEIQVFGDRHGHVVHFGERDCSVQRRNQKVVEEAPSPAVDDTLRAQMRSEEHTSELQSLMRISYAVFCLKKKKINYPNI